jgi:NAD(P)-dependent dehydrogenase (short-subunit alcohol dehydrogenase family)
MSYPETIVIIGSKRGLGKALTSQFMRLGFCVREVNRENWSKDSASSLENFIGCEPSLIIINAHLEFSLGSVLDYILKHTEQKVDILVIGSMSSETQRDYYYPYQLEKSYAKQVVRQFQRMYQDRRILIVKPGLIDTDMVVESHGKKMALEDVAVFISKTWTLSKLLKINVLTLGFTAE